jgi:hypothetical protein
MVLYIRDDVGGAGPPGYRSLSQCLKAGKTSVASEWWGMFVKLSQKGRVLACPETASRLAMPAALFVAMAQFPFVGLTRTYAWPQDAPAPGAVTFNIPSQSLASAIQAFSQASGIEVFYESSIAAERTSSRIEGRYLPDAALQSLLGGAGFTVRFTRRNAVVLSDRSAQNGLPPTRALVNFDLSLDTIRVVAAPERAGDAQLREFGDMVQNESKRYCARIPRSGRSLRRSGHGDKRPPA